MLEGMSYIKDANNFMDKIRDVKDKANNALVAKDNFVGLYPSIPHEAGL